MILLSHVAHEELVAGELLVAALALHLLCLLKKVEITQNELKFGWRQEMSIELRLCVVNDDSRRCF